MSVNMIMNTALSALQANQEALRATSNNVANVNTENYARREVNFTTNATGGVLSGVEVAELERIVDRFLQKEVYQTNADYNAAKVENDFHGRLQDLLGDPTGDLTVTARLNDMLASAAQLGADPTSASRRLDFINQTSRLAEEFDKLGSDIQQLRQDANGQIDEQLERVNTLLAEIHSLNPQIRDSIVSGADPGALSDQRDQAINELSELMEISLEQRDDGQIFVNTRSGLTLVGTGYVQMSYDAPGFVDPNTVFPPIQASLIDQVTGEPTGTPLEVTQHLTGGELRGLLDMRDQVLPNLGEQIGALAAGVFDSINAVHNNSTASPPPPSLSGRNTGLADADPHNFTGTTWLSVVDTGGNLVRKLEVDFTNNTVSVDGGAPTGIGATIGSMEAALDTALAGVGDVTFTDGVLTLSATGGNGIGVFDEPTDPSSRGGRSFAHFFGVNDLVSGRAPTFSETGIVGTEPALFNAGGTIDLQITGADGRQLTSFSYTMTGAETHNGLLASLNTGVAPYGSFALDGDGSLSFTPSASAGANAYLDVVTDSTTRGTTGIPASEFYGMGRQFQMTQALGNAVDPQIAADPNLLALAQVDVDAATVPGDLVVSESDNRGALALERINSDPISFPDAGYLNGTTATLTNFAATVFADLGARADAAEMAMRGSESLSQELTTRLADIQGVSLDEEFANLVNFQKAYNAAARLITTAEELYDTLLAAV